VIAFLRLFLTATIIYVGTSTIEVLPLRAASQTEKHPPRFDRYTAILIFVTLLAVTLRIYGITFKSFWVDEGLSVAYARLPWPTLLHTLWYRELDMAPYYLLLRYWLLLGHSDAMVRGLSVLFSVATVPLFYALGRRLFDRQTAIVAAFLLAIHAYNVRYAQEARSYTMVVFLCVLASWLLVRNVQDRSSGLWGIYTAVCVLAAYTQFYAGLVVIAHLVALALLPRDEVPWKSIVRHVLCFGFLVVPIAIFVKTSDLGRISWISPISGRILLGLGVDLAGNYGRSLLLLMLLTITAALTSARRKRLEPNSAMEAWSYSFVFTWLFVPILLVVAVSLIHPVLMIRYLNPCVPALCLLAAAGITSLRPIQLSWAALALVSLLLILGTISYYDHDFDAIRQDWRTAESYVFHHTQPGDSIYFYSDAGACLFDFYRNQRNPTPLWPKVLNPLLAAAQNPREQERIPGTELRALRPAGDRVWLIFLLPFNPTGGPDTAGAKVRDWFATGRHRIDVQRLHPIDIVLFAKDSAQPASTP